MTPHLTHEQLCDLLLADPSPDPPHESSGRLELLREHLRDCHLCAAEFATLSQSLAVFRSTASAWASHEWTSQASTCSQAGPRIQSLRPSPSRATSLTRALTQPALWASAAALLVAATLPLTLHRKPPAAPKAPSAATAQPDAVQLDEARDEALLEEINETLSSSIPSPMQPLNDPTAGRHSQSDATQRKN